MELSLQSRTSRNRSSQEAAHQLFKGNSSYLSAQFYPFLGRRQEVKEVCAWLCSAETRLLTLTGMGGVGKTRLTLQVARELAAEFVDGVYFVSLASVNDPALVIPTIAQAFGLGEYGERVPLERIKAHIHEQQLLLLLDNLEQVIAATPDIMELLFDCPQLKMLVTSREVLRVHGEQQFCVQPLRLPDLKQLPPVAILARCTAVQLFLQHAQIAHPDFQLNNENAGTIIEICVHLEGLPLAIELAATHVRLLSPQKLLARLERRLPMLIDGARDVSERQQTLRNTIKWSYDLLSAQEQRVFRRCAVFAGGCSLEAIEAVCTIVDGRAINTVCAVRSLLDKHLLQYMTQSDGESRLFMLETIREYALECLELSGEVEITHRAYAEYYLALVEEAEIELRQACQVMWLERLEQEHDNVRSALQWLTGWEDGEKALCLCAGIWRFWILRGPMYSLSFFNPLPSTKGTYLLFECSKQAQAICTSL